MKLVVCFLCLLFIVPLSQSGSLYRWVDASGKVHYADQPPPQEIKEVQERKLAKPTPTDGQTPYAAQFAARNFPVTLYITQCGEICTRAREHLKKRGIPFSEKNPTEPEVASTLEKLAGSVEVPVLVVGKATPIKGYSSESWDAALDVAGYPKTSTTPKPDRPAEPKQDSKAK